MSRGLPIALLALAALAAGCSSRSREQKAPTPQVVPWAADRPAVSAPREPASTPCSASDLSIDRQVKFVLRFTGGIALVPLRNTGKRVCRLEGRPRVGFVKEGGPVQVQRPIPATPTTFPDATYPDSSLLALRPGEPAAVTVSWDNWCDPVVKGRPHVPPSALRVTLPHGRGHLDADYNAVAPCIDPGKPTTIGVSAFQPGLLPGRPPWTPAVLEASVPGQPLHGRRGKVLSYRVVLRNASQTTARFDRCPSYVQQLVPVGKLQLYRLNCGAARAIAPGKSLAFEMRISVPQKALLGANGLFWELDPFGANGPQAHPRLIVDG